MPRKAEPLTDRAIERLKPGKTAIRLAAGGIDGLMLSAQPTGNRVFYLTYRSDGKVVWFRLGEWHPEAFPVEAARSRAAKLRDAIAQGSDPRVDLALARKQAADELQAIKKAASRSRWEDLLDLYIEHAKANRKPRTIAWAVDLIENHLDGTFRKRHADDVVLYPPDRIQRKRRNKTPGAPAAFLAGRFVDEIEQCDIIRLHDAIKAAAGGVTADRCLALVRMAFGPAQVKKWCSDNPASKLGIEPSGETRTVFLEGDQLAALGKALEEVEAEHLAPWQAIAAIKLLLSTGLRKSEVLGLTWKALDLKRGSVRIKNHKTSVKTGDLVQPLSDDALELLRAIASREGAKLSPWVLPGERDWRKPFSNLSKSWGVIRARAGLDDVHLHDLRRTFASWAALTGVELAVASKLMNHSDVSITSKVYAQASQDSKRDGANKIAAGIGAAMRGAR